MIPLFAKVLCLRRTFTNRIAKRTWTISCFLFFSNMFIVQKLLVHDFFQFLPYFSKTLLHHFISSPFSSYLFASSSNERHLEMRPLGSCKSCCSLSSILHSDFCFFFEVEQAQHEPHFSLKQLLNHINHSNNHIICTSSGGEMRYKDTVKLCARERNTCKSKKESVSSADQLPLGESPFVMFLRTNLPLCFSFRFFCYSRSLPCSYTKCQKTSLPFSPSPSVKNTKGKYYTSFLAADFEHFFFSHRFAAFICGHDPQRRNRKKERSFRLKQIVSIFFCEPATRVEPTLAVSPRRTRLRFGVN